MTIIAIAEIRLYSQSEGGICNSIQGRILCPAFYHNDMDNGYSTFIIFENQTFPGSYINTHISLLMKDKAKQIFIKDNIFEFGSAKQIGIGKIIETINVSDEQMIELFHFDIWPGTAHIVQREE